MSIPQEISPIDVYNRRKNETQTVFIDVRSSMEFLFVGHPVGAISIPWIDEPDWDINPNFIKEIKQLLLGGGCAKQEQQPPVFLICRSGKRSLEAGKSLIEAGILNVYNISGGFEGERDDKAQRSSINGWRYDELPWEQC